MVAWGGGRGPISVARLWRDQAAAPGLPWASSLHQKLRASAPQSATKMTPQCIHPTSPVWGRDRRMWGWELLVTSLLEGEGGEPLEEPQPQRPGREARAHPGPGPCISVPSPAFGSQWFPGKPVNTIQMGGIFSQAASLPWPPPLSLPSFLRAAHSASHVGGGLAGGSPIRTF